MKRMLACLVCLLVAMPLAAWAEDPFTFDFTDPFEPREDEIAPAEATDESIRLVIDGESVKLDFDPSPTYSSAEGGKVQASFYAYGTGSLLYELYLTFPDTVQAGMIVTPDYAALTGGDSSVSLIISDDGGETYYYAGLLNGAAFPEGADFAMRFETAADTGAGRSYGGTLSATLIAVDPVSGSVKDTLRIDDAPFAFTLGGAYDRGGAPSPTAEPSDMRKV